MSRTIGQADEVETPVGSSHHGRRGRHERSQQCDPATNQAMQIHSERPQEVHQILPLLLGEADAVAAIVEVHQLAQRRR